MDWLRLTLLGGFSLRDDDGAEVKLPTNKTRALLAYLAYHCGHAHSRVKLTDLLWADRGEKQARQSLNSAAKAIRAVGRKWGLSILESDSTSIGLTWGALDVDVVRFRKLNASDPLAAALLHGGSLLDGFQMPCPEFEDWAEASRREIAREAMDGLLRGSTEAEQRGDLGAAIDAAERVVSMDPLREDVHRRLMRLLVANGDRASAIRQFQACNDALIRDLGVAPDAETTSLHAALIGSSDVDLLTSRGATRHEPAHRPAQKPSIAVLPFQTYSPDDDRQLFGDGVAGDVIAGLSRFRWLHVIARASSFALLQDNRDLASISSELGVRYLLRGAITESGGRVRVAAELADCSSGACIWAEHFDKKLDDVFTVHDQITNAIVQHIVPEIERREHQEAQFSRPSTADAWVVYQRGLIAFHRVTEPSLRKAIALFERSVELDPEFAAAHAHAAAGRMRLISAFRPNDVQMLIAEAKTHVDAALQLDVHDYTALFVSGVLASFEGRHEIAEERVRQSIDHNPNDAFVWAILCFVLRRGGKPTEALSAVEQAIRLSPLDPEMAMFMANRTTALYDNKRFDACAENGYRTIDRSDAYASTFATLAAALVKLDRPAEATEVLKRMWERYPDYSFDRLNQNISSSRAPSERSRADVLREAGLLE